MVKNIALGLAALVIIAQALLLAAAHSASVERMRAESKQYVCLNGDQIATTRKVTHCKRVIWREDPEDLGN